MIIITILLIDFSANCSAFCLMSKRRNKQTQGRQVKAREEQTQIDTDLVKFANKTQCILLTC